MADFSAHGNEHPACAKVRRFLYQLNDYQLLKKESPPWG